MALSAAIDWDCQPGGNANNGGGFNRDSGGTDRTNSTTPYLEIDGTSVVATVGASTDRLAFSLGHTVATGDKGNLVRITGAFSGTVTNGLYEITNVDTGTGEWILDRACGTTGGKPIANMGGCLSAIADLGTSTPLLAGHRIRHKGSLTIGTGGISAVTLPAVGQIDLIGYTTTRDDGVAPTWTAGSGVTMLTCNSASTTNWRISTLCLDGADIASSRGLNATAGSIAWINCEFKRFKNSACNLAAVAWFSNCLFTSHTNTTVVTSSSTAMFSNCRLSGNTVTVLQGQSSSRLFVYHCLFHDNTGTSTDAVQVNGSSGYAFVANCTIDGSGRYGVSIQATTGINQILNTLVTNSGSYGIQASATVESLFTTNCAFYNNTSGDYSGISAGHKSGDITLTGDPYTDRGSDDYSLNSTAGAGGACRDAGYPTTLNNFQTSRNVGAFDVAAGGGGSAGILVHPGMAGGMRG